MKLYVASSWRNDRQPGVVDSLRRIGHDVYDFRHPGPGDDGFAWRSIDPDWETRSMARYRRMLSHPIAEHGFKNDYDAMKWADGCVLVMPCGRSAHLEAGYFVGAGKPLYILLSDGEPELMYKMATYLCINIDELKDNIKRYDFTFIGSDP